MGPDMPALIAEGVRVFEEWEDGVDYNGGSAALRPDIERLVEKLFEIAWATSEHSG